MSETEKILTAIINGKMEVLLDFLSEEEIKKNRVEPFLSEYKWAGDYAEDARYTYPNRERLISTVLRKLLKETQKEKPKVSKAFVGKVTARIYCDRKSVKAIKTNVREAFEEAGLEVE